MNMTIQKRIENLPVKPEDISRFLLFEKPKLHGRIEALKKIKKIGNGVAGYHAALENTQDTAEYLLYAEAKLGEILAAIPPKRHGCGSRGGTSPTLPPDIDKKQSHIAQTLHKHEEKIADYNG